MRNAHRERISLRGLSVPSPGWSCLLVHPPEREAGRRTTVAYRTEVVYSGVISTPHERKAKTMTRSAAKQKLIAHTDAQSTNVLMGALRLIDQRPSEQLTAEERITYATICDVVEARHDLHDLAGDILDEEPIDSEITYGQALITAMAMKTAA